MNESFDFYIGTLANLGQLSHGNLTCQNNSGQTKIFPKFKRFIVGCTSLSRQVNLQTRCFRSCNRNQGWVRNNNSRNPDIPQTTEPFSSTCFVSFVHDHIGRYIDLGTMLSRKLDTFFHLLKSEVPCTAAQTIGLTTNKNSICPIANSYF